MPEQALDKLSHPLVMRSFPVHLIASQALAELIEEFAGLGCEPVSNVGLLYHVQQAITADAATEWGDRARQIIAPQNLDHLPLWVGFAHIVAIDDDAALEQAA